MSKPANPELYGAVKKEIYARIPKHSAYRSGLLVQEYKRRGGTYIGKRPKKEGLTRWFEEEWRADDGKVGYASKSNVYRPTKRITSETPLTFDELSKAEIARTKREKARTGRVERFRKVK